MTVPPPLPRAQTFIEVARTLNQMVPELSKGMTNGKKVFARTRRLARGLTNVQDRFKFLSKEFSQAKQAQKELLKLSKEVNKVAKEAGITATKATKNIDTITQGIGGVSKGGKLLTRMGSAFIALAPIITALAAVGIAIAVNEIQGWRNDLNDKSITDLSRDVSKTLGFLSQQAARIEAVKKDISKVKLEDQRTRDRVYGLEKQLPEVRQKTNDALYETRQGRRIVEEKIKTTENNINTRINKISDTYQKVRADIDSLIKNTQTGINKQIQDTISKIQQAQLNTDNKVKSANDGITAQRKIIDSLQATIKAIKPPTPTDINKITSDTIDKVKQLFNSQLSDIPSIKNAAVQAKQVAEQTNKDFQGFKTIEDARFVALKTNDEVLAKAQSNLANAISNVDDKVPALVNKSVNEATRTFVDRSEVARNYVDRVSAETNFVTRTEVERKVYNEVSEQTKSIEADLAKNQRKIADLDNQTRNILTQNRSNIDDIKRIDKALTEQQKVNAEGNGKLDQMVPLLAALPLAIAAIPSLTAEQVPNISGIEGAVQSGMCKSTQPGGCTKGALDDAVNNINQNANANKGNILDALNAGGQAVDLAILNTINNKLGDAIPGGLSGKLVDGFKWLHLDRALNALTFIATIQNHLMLSNDIGQTLLGALNNGLQLIGLKDDKGNPFDIGSVISSGVENFVKGIVGAENYTELSAGYAKANRIYQATTNILNTFQGFAQTILQVNELLGAGLGKIGNALRSSGTVLENAYQWMNPQPKFNRITQGLEALQQGASTIQQVTQVPLDVISQATELTNAATEFTKAIKEDGKPENKAVAIPEPETIKAQADASKTVSTGSPTPDITDYLSSN